MSYRFPRRLFRCIALPVVLLLAGCQALPRPADVPAVPIGPPAPRDAQADLMYQVLLGEMAGQRGNLGTSVQSYLDAAQASGDPRVAQRATQVALYARDLERARQAAERWLALQPDSLEARQALAMLYLRAGRVEPAVEQFDRLIGAAKDGADQAFVQVALLLGREQNKDVALKVMQGLVDRHPQRPYAYLSLSQLAAVAQQLERAEQAADRALQLKPGWNAALVLRARIQAQRGDVDKAVESLQHALDQHPGDTELRMNYARLLVQAKRLPEARAQFQRLARAAPDDPDVHYALALLALDAGDNDAAARSFQRLLKLGKRMDEARFYLGRIAEDRKHWSEAMNWYGQVEEGEHQLEAELRIAELLAKRGELDAALERLHALQEQNPALAGRIVLVEGELLVNAQRNREAMALYDRELAREPDNNDVLYARALLAEKMGRIEQLERDLRAILKRDPGNAMALNALGYTLADRTTRYDEALALITQALKLLPDDAAVLDSMGWVQFRFGRHDEALKYLRRAYEINDDAEIAAHLGEVLWASGDKAGARKVWNKARQTDPDNQALKNVLQRFRP